MSHDSFYIKVELNAALLHLFEFQYNKQVSRTHHRVLGLKQLFTHFQPYILSHKAGDHVEATLL